MTRPLFDTDKLPIVVPIEKQIAAVDREIRARANRYPRRVQAGLMSSAKAKQEIELMQAVRASLVQLYGVEA